jgi:hypothetical protein
MEKTEKAFAVWSERIGIFYATIASDAMDAEREWGVPRSEHYKVIPVTITYQEPGE